MHLKFQEDRLWRAKLGLNIQLLTEIIFAREPCGEQRWLLRLNWALLQRRKRVLWIEEMVWRLHSHSRSASIDKREPEFKQRLLLLEVVPSLFSYYRSWYNFKYSYLTPTKRDRPFLISFPKVPRGSHYLTLLFSMSSDKRRNEATLILLFIFASSSGKTTEG